MRARRWTAESTPPDNPQHPHAVATRLRISRFASSRNAPWSRRRQAPQSCAREIADSLAAVGRGARLGVETSERVFARLVPGIRQKTARLRRCPATAKGGGGPRGRHFHDAFAVAHPDRGAFRHATRGIDSGRGLHFEISAAMRIRGDGAFDVTAELGGHGHRTEQDADCTGTPESEDSPAARGVSLPLPGSGQSERERILPRLHLRKSRFRFLGYGTISELDDPPAHPARRSLRHRLPNRGSEFVMRRGGQGAVVCSREGL